MRLSWRWGIILAVTAIAACSDEPPSATSAQVFDSAGIRIVAHTRFTEAPRWRLDLASGRELGGGGSGIELFAVTGARQLPDGGIVVADAGNHRLLFFDGAGALRDSVGGEGEGPGEFKDISVLARSAGDSLVVWDRSLRRISVLDGNGRFGRTIALERTDSVRFASVIGVYSDGSYAATGFVDIGGGTVTTGRHSFSSPVYHFGADGSFLEKTGIFPTGESYFESVGGGGFRISRALFADNAYRERAGDRFLFASSAEYELRYYAPDGTLRQVVRREPLARPVTSPDRADEIDRLVRDAPEQFREGMEGLLNEMDSPALLPEIRALFVDPLGRAWVEEFRSGDAQDGAPWHVYGPDGLLVGVVTLPDRFRLMDAAIDYVIGVKTDELGIESVLRAPVLSRPADP